MSESFDVLAAAADIYSRIQHGEHFPGAWRGKFSFGAAYRVQLAIRDLRVADGDRQTGWKIGLTARAIQEQEGFHEPVFAILYESGMRSSGAQFTHADLIKPAFENELCITLGKGLPEGLVDMHAARTAIATVTPALEIVEGRGILSETPELAVADNLGQLAYVLGQSCVPETDAVLSEATCAVSINGELVEQAQGSAVLDDPANAVAWLANKLAAYDERIEPGQLVMSGSFTRGFRVETGESVETRFDPYGIVSAAFV